jgi:hypothetical protein
MMFQEFRRAQTDLGILHNVLDISRYIKKILRRKREKKSRRKAGSNICEDIWLKGYEEK